MSKRFSVLSTLEEADKGLRSTITTAKRSLGEQTRLSGDGVAEELFRDIFPGEHSFNRRSDGVEIGDFKSEAQQPLQWMEVEG